MGYKDLRHYLEDLFKSGELQHIHAPCDPDQEIAAITHRVMKNGGPALFFEEVVGSSVPIVTNLFGTPSRAARALGVNHLDELEQRVEGFLSQAETLVGGGGVWGKLGAIKDLLHEGRIAPRRVRNAPVQEVVERPDLRQIPALTTWPEDGGPFLTLPIVITKDPQSGHHNLGMYRMQIHTPESTGMHWHRHKDGAAHQRARGSKPLEVAVALGADPATIYAATAPLPEFLSEYLLAGFLRGEPVEVVQAKTVDLLVPAHAEWILEGTIEPGDLQPEGPFGDHTGFYSPQEPYPVFHIKAITRRRDPIYPATIVGPPTMEDAFLGKATERIFLPILRRMIPEIVDINLPVEGGFHNLAVVSIRKTYPGAAQKVMHALWGMGQMSLVKVILVVDEDVNVADLSQVAWIALSHLDPARDLLGSRGPLDELDHASPYSAYGSKLGIDATRKGRAEGHPRPWPKQAQASTEILERVFKRWKELGL